MTLEDYRTDMLGCSRCSMCKWIPLNQVKSWRYAKACPSVSRYNFHAYSGSGKMNVSVSLLDGRIELDETVADIAYKCTLCGACDVSCKVYRDDIELCEVIEELRELCVTEGQLIPEHMIMIDSMKKDNNVFGEPKSERGDWAEGLGLKCVNTERADVLFHAGCRFSYDRDLRDRVRGVVELLLKTGVDVGIAGKEESCCGGRAYEIGYRGEMNNYADDMAARVKASGATTLVTPCSDCYSTFKYFYPRTGKDLGIEVLHVTEYIQRLVEDGRITLSHKVPLNVTYHDPCHLGRRGEPYPGKWEGDKLLRPLSMKRAGRNGVFGPPRDILKAIPGLRLTEMERIKEYSWCCGAGGGVLEAYPDFALWSAAERIREARATGAEAMVTSCPWCERSFLDAVAETGEELEIYDLSELVAMSMGTGGE
jgi:Fe-S oxidoreductase